MAAEIHKIENVFLKTAAPEPRPGTEELGTDAAVRSNRSSHFPNIGATRLAERCNRVDRTDPLSQKSIRSELGQFTAPQVCSQDSLCRHPVAVDPCQGVDGLGIIPSDQDPIRSLQISDRRAFCKELGIGQHGKAAF